MRLLKKALASYELPIFLLQSCSGIRSEELEGRSFRSTCERVLHVGKEIYPKFDEGWIALETVLSNLTLRTYSQGVVGSERSSCSLVRITVL